MTKSILAEHQTVKMGDVYGQLTVDGPEFRLGRIRRGRVWHFSACLWRCSCGQLTVLDVYSVKSGNTKSCGCLSKANAIKQGRATRKHGGFGTKLYTVWVQIKYRCHNPACASFTDYGGRGIGICSEWDQSFPVFRDWAIANGWRPELQIDRRDNNRGYSPDNCRFVTMIENLRNRRITKLITAWGETKPLTAWIEDQRCKCSESGLRHRLFPYKKHNRKWSAEDAISTPPLNVHSYARK
jgi:hypothetical protein